MAELGTRELIAIGLMVVGVTFDLIGCLGLVRLPDVYNRLQAGTKCVTLGTCSLLLGAAVMANGAAGVTKALLCLVFVVITSPTAAHALARGAHAAGIPLAEGTVIDAYAEEKRGAG